MDTQPADEETGEIRLVPTLAKTLLTYLRSARENERGGVLIGGFGDGGVVEISGAVFPPQLTRMRTRCAFDVVNVDIVCEAVAQLGERAPTLVVIVGWVHSHPTWGTFMSETDKETLRSWTSLDDRAVAVVIDPFASREEERIASWNRHGRSRLAVTTTLCQFPVTIQRASHLAETISRLTTSGRWDVLVSGGIITVFSAWTQS